MNSQNDQKLIPLESNIADYSTAIGKVATGLLPFIGSALGELLTQVIPGQRMDRIVDFLQRVNRKIAHIELQLQQERTKRDVDLIEAALWYATRAPSEERRERIACLVALSLTRDQVDSVADKKLLDLLGEINDLELLILQWHALSHGQKRDEFFEQHRNVLYAPAVHFGSTTTEVDRGAIHRAYKEHLVRLGLIHRRFKKPRRGELPEFDEKSGTMKASGEDITWLGRMVLGAVGLQDDLRSGRVSEDGELDDDGLCRKPTITRA